MAINIIPAHPILLSIPLETRRTIFALLFTSSSDIYLQRSYATAVPPYTHELPLGCSLSSQILRTCHQIFDEGCPMLYSTNVFNFNGTFDVDFSTIEHVIGGVNFAAIRHAKFVVAKFNESHLIRTNGEQWFRGLKQVDLSSWHVQEWTASQRLKSVRILLKYHPDIGDLVAEYPELDFRLLCSVGVHKTELDLDLRKVIEESLEDLDGDDVDTRIPPQPPVKYDEIRTQLLESGLMPGEMIDRMLAELKAAEDLLALERSGPACYIE